MTSNATTMTVPHTRTTPGLDRVAVALLLGFVGIAAGLDCARQHPAGGDARDAGRRCSCATACGRRRPRSSLPLLAYGGDHARLRGVLGRSAHQPRRFQAAVLFAVVPAVYDLARGRRAATVDRRDRDRRRRVGGVRHHPVRHAALRQPAPAAAGRAHALHDLLGRADAGHLRRDGAPGVRVARPHLAGARDAGPRRRAGAHPVAQRVGRRLRRRRPAARAERLPPERRAARGHRRGLRHGAGRDHQPHDVDVRRAGSRPTRIASR